MNARDGKANLEAARARELVLKHGWNATAFQIVNPGFEHWFTTAGDSVVGFVRASRTFVVAGSPVCGEDRLAAVLDEWESWCRRRHARTCYFGAAGRLYERLANRPGYSTIVLGAQPTWDPATWAATVDCRPSLRAQFRRASNKGVSVNEWPSDQAERDPRLRQCLNQWQERRGLPPMHFLVEPQILSHLAGRRVFVAEQSGWPVGFLTASPIPARNGWLTEQFVRGEAAPNGTVELMVDAVARAVAADGSRYLTMGLAPLCNHVKAADNPAWLRWLLAWMKAHGRRFFNFDGLAAFKAKFRPHSWEPIYAVSNEIRFSFRTLYSIAAAFGGRSPISLALHAGLRAISQELRWLSRGR
jgi:phosphatidylglycerol lysyltransferase